MGSLLARLCATCLAVFSVSIATASAADGAINTGDLSGELTLTQAIGAALARNPDLAAAEYELRAADARITQAGLRPNPELSGSLENFGGSGSARGVKALETTLSLSQVIEIAGKRGYRVAVATQARELSGIERQAQQLDVLAEVTRRFIDVVSAQQQRELTGSARALAQTTLDAISTRVAAARSPEAERSRARIALTRAQIEQQQAETELRAARSALAALWGSQEPAFGVARADIFDLEAIEPFEILASRMLRNPALLRFVSEARLRDAELQLARARARPNLAVGVGLRRLADTHDVALVAGVSIPLAIFDRNQGAIREAEVRREQTDAQQRASQLRIRAAAFSLYQELLASRTRVETLRGDALPQAQLAVDQTRVGYERGRFSYLELATAQQELIDLQAAAITAAADYHRILTDIERLTGEALAVDVNTQELP